MNISEATVEHIRTAVQENSKVVITNHVNPDGDAMGSALGLALILKKLAKEVHVVVPNAYPHFLNWISGADAVVEYGTEAEKARELIAAAELIFHLDYNSLKRSGDLQPLLSSNKATKVVVDHHQQPDDFPDILVSDPAMSSTCEMIFHLAEKLNWQQYFDSDFAQAIYAGIMTDTGNFRFSSTTPETHRVAGELLKLGVKSQEVASRIYDTNSRNRLKLLSRALQRMEVLPQYATAIISLSEEDLKEFDYKKGDTEGFVNYGLSLEGVEFSAFAYPKGELVKISFRSKSNFDVNAFARKHFNGGGHLNAAGGAVDASLEETIEKIKNALPSYEEALPSL